MFSSRYVDYSWNANLNGIINNIYGISSIKSKEQTSIKRKKSEVFL